MACQKATGVLEMAKIKRQKYKIEPSAMIFFKEFEVVKLAVTEAKMKGITDEAQVATWAVSYGRHISMTKARALALLDVTLRDLFIYEDPNE